MSKLIIKNKKICVVGLQGPGIALIEALLKGGAKVTGAQLLDDAEQKFLFSKISRDKAAWILSRDGENQFFDQDLIIFTVGYKSFKEAVRAAKEKGIPVLGELDFVSQYFRGTVVGITGTNGKTTTATILHKIFEEAQIPAMVVEGGSHNPMAMALGKDLKVVICELNSVRLRESENFKPHVAVITNLSQAHPERHKNIMDYWLTKAKIYEHQEAQDFLVYNGLSEAIKKIIQEKSPKAALFPFHFNEVQTNGIFPNGAELCFQKQGVLSKFNLAGFSLKGAHNLENLMAALGAAKLLGVPDQAIQQAIPKLKPLPIRLEPMGKIEGIEYYNDARSANPGSTAWALHTLKKNVILIAGGQFLKGIHYESLHPFLKGHAKMLILFGLDRKRFHEVWGDAVETYLVETLKDTLLLAARKAEKGDSILFSPAAPPEFHAHANVDIRGEDFAALLQELRDQEKQRRSIHPNFDKI